MSSAALKPRLLRLRYFVWLIVPLAVYWISQTYGLPHMRWSYQFVDYGGEATKRYYTRCTYVAFDGVLTIHPTHGACPFLQLFPAK